MTYPENKLSNAHVDEDDIKELKKEKKKEKNVKKRARLFLKLWPNFEVKSLYGMRQSFFSALRYTGIRAQAS